MLKDEGFLKGVIKQHKKHNAHSERNVFTKRFFQGLQSQLGSPTCHAISQEVAQGYGDCKTKHLTPTFAMRLKGEMLVEKIAQNTPQHIVSCGREPIATTQEVVGEEHHRRAKEGVHHTH